MRNFIIICFFALIWGLNATKSEDFEGKFAVEHDEYPKFCWGETWVYFGNIMSVNLNCELDLKLPDNTSVKCAMADVFLALSTDTLQSISIHAICVTTFCPEEGRLMLKFPRMPLECAIEFSEKNTDLLLGLMDKTSGLEKDETRKFWLTELPKAFDWPTDENSYKEWSERFCAKDIPKSDRPLSPKTKHFIAYGWCPRDG